MPGTDRLVASIRVSSPVVRTPRVMQMESLFDVPPAEKTEMQWDVELPLDARDWNVGLICGPSGSGKSTILREMFHYEEDRAPWPADRSVLDGFPEHLSIKDVVGSLTAVGFSSPPSWMRPYHVLSNGEQFRATVARLLTTDRDPTVIDEFTSVVDRQIAQVASHAIQKAVRRANRRLVVATCHYDVFDWLQPDWVLQPHLNDFQWRYLQRRPDIRLDIYKVHRDLWRVFRQHHYLSTECHQAATCFAAYVGPRPVAFTSYLHQAHPRVSNIKRGHRLVVLPDWQGLGIGGRLDDWLGQYLYDRGLRYHNVVAHPAMVAYYSKSPRWQQQRAGPGVPGSKRISARTDRTIRERQFKISSKRFTYTFEYVPPPPAPTPAEETVADEHVRVE